MGKLELKINLLIGECGQRPRVRAWGETRKEGGGKSQNSSWKSGCWVQ